MDNEQRLTELEVRLAFIDDTVQALVTADAEQSLRLAALEQIVRDLRSELATMRAGQVGDPLSEPPPPHY